MSTPIVVNKRLEEIDILSLFAPDEGSIDLIYGRIGNGKNTYATKRILDLLNRGMVVYVNYPVRWNGYDERTNFWRVVSYFFGFRRALYVYDRSNLRRIAVDKDFYTNFEKITDAYVFLDEGQAIWDSYVAAKMSMSTRMAILSGRHFGRTITVISQRPTAIHVTARGNVNRFFRCELLWNIFFTLFRITEFQDMVNDTVDEEGPVSVKYFFGTKKLFSAFDSKYLRTIPPQNLANVTAYKYSFFGSFVLLRDLLPLRGRGAKREAERVVTRPASIIHSVKRATPPLT